MALESSHFRIRTVRFLYHALVALEKDLPPHLFTLEATHLGSIVDIFVVNMLVKLPFSIGRMPCQNV